MTERLAGAGDASQVELLRARRSATEADAQLANRRNKYVQDVSSELAKAREELEQVEQQANQRRQQLANVVIRAPMAGIVKNVACHDARRRTAPRRRAAADRSGRGQDDRRGEGAAAGYRAHTPGLPATIRFDAYDYTIFGAVDGEVIYVSADTMRDDTQKGDATYYRVHVRTTAPGPQTRTGRKIDVIPGMTAQVDIRTGQRSLLTYLAKPLLKTLSEAFKER